MLKLVPINVGGGEAVPIGSEQADLVLRLDERLAAMKAELLRIGESGSDSERAALAASIRDVQKIIRKCVF